VSALPPKADIACEFTGLLSEQNRKLLIGYEGSMKKSDGEKKRPCKNCEGKGTLKKGDKIVRCQRCGGTGIKPS
jgi:DnaJ-class molecular chaperone